MKVAYPEPEYTDFCEKEQVIKNIDNQEECLVGGGQWTEQMDRFKPVSVYEGEIIAIDSPTGYCDQQFTCRKDFDTAREDYERNVFIALYYFW